MGWQAERTRDAPIPPLSSKLYASNHRNKFVNQKLVLMLLLLFF